MGSSAKKRKSKKADFHVKLFPFYFPSTAYDQQKPRFKVGKVRPKPANFTDTSFRSKCKNPRFRDREVTAILTLV